VDSSDFDRIKEIFLSARELNGEERERCLDRLCGDDVALRAEVIDLLEAHEADDSFLDSRALDAAGSAGIRHIDSSTGPAIEGPGDRIGPYKLLQVIGEGGFGIVYMAEQDAPIRRRVALKLIKPGMDSKQVIARFEAERQALAMMDHPNIARVFDAGTTPHGRPFFVMELVKGIPLTDYCDENRLDTRDRLALFNDVCSAVHHAHQSGIIHRDIKPSNVMVTLHDGRPVPKVIDFGVAKAIRHRLTESTLFTEYRQFIGTPAYMSPEQAAYEGLDVDPRSDVYSLGVLLYELLTGTTPHDSASLKRAAYGEVLRILKEEEPPKPSTRVHTMGGDSVTHAMLRGADPDGLEKLLRGDLDCIIMKALEKDRRRRYESASELADDVQRYFDSRPIHARPPSSIYKARKFVRRHRGPLGAAAVVTLAVSASLAWVGWQGSRLTAMSTAIGPAGGQPTVMLASSDGLECYLGGFPSPDGRTIAYGDYCARYGIYLYDTETGKETQLTGDTLYQSLAWSPDGARIATAPWGTRPLPALRILSVATGEDETPAHLVDLPFAPEAWSNRGNWLAGVMHGLNQTNSLQVVSLDTGDRLVLAENIRRFQSSLAFSPDGRFITYAGAAGNSEDLFVADLTSGERWPLVTGPELEHNAVWSPDGGTIAFQNGSGIWAVPVAEGRPVGEPYFVRTGNQTPIAWTASGFYYGVSNVVSRGLRVRFDAEAGGATGEREPFSLPTDADVRNMNFAWSPDGSTSATASGDLLYITDSLSTRTIPLAVGTRPSKLWWSGDGTEVLFWPRAGRRTVHAVDVGSGSIREVYPPVSLDSLISPHITPDGERMVFIRPMRELVLAEVGSTDGRVLASANETGVFSNRLIQPQFSPDGRHVAYMLGPDGATTTLWTVDTDGTNQTLVATAEGDGVIMEIAWHPGSSLIAYREWNGMGPSPLRVVSITDGTTYDVGSFDPIRILGWSPDGQWILINQPTGRTEMWVTRDILEEGQRAG